MIDATTKGICYQIKADKFDLNLIASIDLINGLSILDELKKMQLIAAQCHEDPSLEEAAVDYVSSAFPDTKMVKKARADEIEYVRTMKLYTKVPKSECLKMTVKQPIVVRWIDVNNQDSNNPLYRSRLVGKEFNTYNDKSLYAATPNIEALRLILSIAATNKEKRSISNHDQ